MLEGFVQWPEEFRDTYIKKGYWENVALGDAFDRIAEFFPKREALVFGDERISYGMLKNITDRLARGFLNTGLKPLDTVVLQLPNIPEFVYCFLALLKAGIIPVLCLPQHRLSEISGLAAGAKAKAYIVPDVYRDFDYLELAREVQAAVPSVEKVFIAGGKSREGQTLISTLLNSITDAEVQNGPELNRPDPLEVALLLLSGGTTGVPKMIPRTHNDYVYNARINALYVGINRYAVYLAVAPMAHNMTLACPGILGTFLYGGKVVLAPSTDPQTICSLVQKEKVTILPLVPAIVINLLSYEARKEYDLSSLFCLISGASKLNPEVAKRVGPELGCTLFLQFGMAEGMITLSDPNAPDEMTTIGRPLSPGDEVRIVDEEGRDVGPGETGELLCRGPYTLRGYFNAPEINAKSFTPDGFYRTGDVVRRDPANGCLVIDGRQKDLINRGGEKISAEEVENWILAHPKVKNTAVVAMPDPVLGERSCAFVILKPDETLDLKELTEFLLEKKMAKFKIPERLETVESFPLTNVGKVSKKDLRLLIEQKLKSEAALA